MELNRECIENLSTKVSWLKSLLRLVVQKSLSYRVSFLSNLTTFFLYIFGPVYLQKISKKSTAKALVM